MVVLIGALYVEYGTQPWIASAFYGIGAAVIAIIIRSSLKLTKTTLKKDFLLWAIFALSFAATLLFGGTRLWTFIAGGAIALLVSYFIQGRKGQQGLKSVIFPALLLQVGVASDNRTFIDILVYFLKAGFIVFGSGLAIVPFLRGGVVNDFHWLTDRQFLDAVAVAMITPGPVVITVAFIGYLVHGFSGAVAAAIGVFLPVYLFVVLLAPLFERISGNEHVRDFIRGVTAIATGAIAAAILLLSKSAIVDVPTVIILLVSAVLLFKFKLPEPALIGLAAIAGLVIRGV
jgi:chromate transporter